MNFKGNAGASKIITLLIVSALGLGIHTAYQMVDARYKIAEFEEKVSELANYPDAYYSNRGTIIEEVMGRARAVFDNETGAPVTRASIKVEGKGKSFRIQVAYTYTIKTPLYSESKNITIEKASPHFSGQTSYP